MKDVHEARLLRLINRYLKAGVDVEGTVGATTMGVARRTSPVLANVVLDDWIGNWTGAHRFARLHDCNILVKQTSGERVMGRDTLYRNHCDSQ